MKTKLSIEIPQKAKDYFPSVFANKDNSIIILADEKTSEKTFSGMIIHSPNSTKNTLLGTYSTGWTYVQFTRLPIDSIISITLKQEVPDEYK